MRDVSIARLTSFQNQGMVSTLVQVGDVEALSEAFKIYPNMCVLGRGSNSVIDPEDEKGVYLQIMESMLPMSVESDVLTVSSGVAVNSLLSFCQRKGLLGLTFSAGVPASVGGMVAMNFGCWGQEISDCLESAWVRFPDGELAWVTADQFGFSYRSSYALREKWVVLGGKFYVESVVSDVVRKDIHDKVRRRLETQPLRGKTFGSIFKNPEGLFSGKLMEDAGLKGYRIGGAQLSDLHANFMVNVGGATLKDVRDLIVYAKKVVLEYSGISLVEEVQYLP